MARFAPPPGNVRNTVQAAPHAGPPATVGSPVSEHAAVANQPNPDLGNASAGGITGRIPAGGPGASLSEGTSSASDGVVVPPTADRGEEQRLPVFNSVESSWFREGRGAPTLASSNPAPGDRWSSPADVGWRAASAANSPASAGSTTAGLPKRMPNANLVPGAIPSPEPVIPSRSPAAARERLASLQRGVDKGRAATRQAASPGQDEEIQPGTAD